MKKSTTIVLVSLLVVALIIPHTLALTSQSLFYRIEDGDRFYYTMELIDENETVTTDVIYVEIDNASKPIPDPLADLADLDYPDIGLYYENGTTMGLSAIMFIFTIPQFVFPVGNWSLIDSLAATDLEDTIFVDTNDLTISYGTDYWGFTYTYNSSDTESTIWVDYSIFDGMFSRWTLEYMNTTTSELIERIDVSRLTNHGLSWGFTDGARFDFHLSMTGDGAGFSDMEEDFYLKVDEDGLNTIPYLVDEWADVPYLGGDIYWANDTISYDSFLGHSWRLAVPLGNWSLLDTLIQDMSPAVNITVDDLEPWYWGYTRDEMIGDVLVEVHTDHLKTDGFLAHHTAVFTNTTTSEQIGTITVIRAGLEVYDDSTAPVINHPDDMEFVEGTEHQNITWTLTDDYPDDFEISVNGVVVDLGSWTSPTSIVVDLGVFNEGVYNCSLIVYDVAGNYAVDWVLVNVTAAATTSTGSGIVDLIMDNILYVALGVGAVVILGAIVCMRRKS